MESRPNFSYVMYEGVISSCESFSDSVASAKPARHDRATGTFRVMYPDGLGLCVGTAVQVSLL